MSFEPSFTVTHAIAAPAVTAVTSSSDTGVAAGL